MTRAQTHIVTMGILTAALVLLFATYNGATRYDMASGAEPVRVAVTINRHTEVSTENNTLTVSTNVPVGVSYEDTAGGTHQVFLGAGTHTINEVQNYELTRTL